MVEDKMAAYVWERCGGGEHVHDAVRPIVSAEGRNTDSACFNGRYDKGEAEYLNGPMDKEEDLAYREALLGAEKAVLHDFEKGDVFEGCMPIEALAARGEDAMRYGPLRPAGFRLPDGIKP